MSLLASAVFWLVAAPPLGVLCVVLFNLAAWPRGRRNGRVAGRVSALVPARNEAANVEACVRALLAGTVTPHEVIVYDDASTDGTGEIVERMAADDGRVRLVRGTVLPAGWVGKPHACHCLAEEATGDVLLFVDADTVATPECLARLGSLLDDFAADVVTVGPRQLMGSFAERLVVPLLHLSWLAWLPVPLVWRTRDPRILVANGQMLAVRRSAYERAGGWEAVRGEVVDDMAFCRRVKSSGGRVVFADGHRMAACRMYRGAGEVWRGFSKNLYEGVGGSPAALAIVLLLHAWIFVLPYVALAVGLAGRPTLLTAAATGVAANVALRAALAVRFRQPAEGVMLHPLSILALIAIALNSAAWSRRGRILWRERSYEARAARVGR